MTTPIRPPKDDLFRAMQSGVVSEDGRTLTIRLAPGDAWAEIDSVTEGHFMERFRPGAYRKTMAENPPKIMFQHGRDPEVGEKVIATTDEAGEDATSPFARGRLLDGLPELVVSGLRAGAYGSSHRFSVVRDDFNPKPKPGPHNPKGLPERTITEARLFELGPVTWPAYAQASASLRSLTDEFRLNEITSDPARLREIVAYIEPAAPSIDAGAPPHLEPERREPVASPTPPTPERKATVEYVTRDEKSSRVTELKQALARQAIEYPGVLPPDAQASWDADTAELDALERDIRAWDERQARLATYAEDAEKRQGYNPPTIVRSKSESDIFDYEDVMRRGGTEEQRGQIFRDNAMRVIERMRFPHPDVRPDEARTNVQMLLDYKDTRDHELARRIILTGSPLYYRAFNKLACGLPLTAEEQRGTALAMGVTTTGGYLVPAAFDPTLIPIGAWTSANPVRAVARVEQIVGSNVWHGLTSTAVTATRATEATVMVEQGPTLGQPSIQPTKVQGQITYSYETGEDRPDLGSEFARLMMEAKDTEEEAIFAHGVGDALAPLTNPIGVFANATGTVGAFTPLATTGDGVFAIGDVDRTYAALPLRHRSNAVWMMGREILGAVQGFETSGGRLFGATVGYPAVGSQDVPDNSGNTGLRLLGRPVYESPSGKDISDLAGKPLLAFFNPTQYVIVDRVGMTVEFIPNLLSAGTVLASGQRALVFHYRNSAKPVNVDGGRRLCYT
jgi:HK97 family phage major capsid protein